MKKAIMILALALVCSIARSGEVGLPTEHIALPAVTAGGSYLVCIWDETSGQWLQAHQSYDQSGAYDFQVPAWNNWYWIGLWDSTNGQYVFAKWIGHFLTD